MDEVYAMLIKEKEKLAQKKTSLEETLAHQRENLLTYKKELQ